MVLLGVCLESLFPSLLPYPGQPFSFHERFAFVYVWPRWSTSTCRGTSLSSSTRRVAVVAWESRPAPSRSSIAKVNVSFSTWSSFLNRAASVFLPNFSTLRRFNNSEFWPLHGSKETLPPKSGADKKVQSNKNPSPRKCSSLFVELFSLGTLMFMHRSMPWQKNIVKLHLKLLIKLEKPGFKAWF